MDYVLITNFSCKIYRKQPTIRLFVSETFIDEYELTDNPNYDKDYECITKNHRDLSNLNLNNLKFYDLKLKNPYENINFDFKNNDNNYNNGFISKATYINCNVLYLIPKKIFSNYENFYDGYKWHFGSESLAIRKKKIDCMFLLFSRSPFVVFKGITKETLVDWHSYFNGNGYISIDLRKKHNIYLPQRDNHKWHGKLGIPYKKPIMLLHNKYLQYEDQRNNN